MILRSPRNFLCPGGGGGFHGEAGNLEEPLGRQGPHQVDGPLEEGVGAGTLRHQGSLHIHLMENVVIFNIRHRFQ